MNLLRNRFGKVTLFIAVTAVALATASASLALRSRAGAADSAKARAASVIPIAHLRVLGRGQSAADRSTEASDAVATMLGALPAIDPATFRVALRGFGGGARTAFVARGRDGRICAGLTEFSSGCLDGLPPDLPVDVTYGGGSATEGPIVWGLARDDVRAVEVVEAGVVRSAALGENVYVFQAQPGVDPAALSAVKVHLANGTVFTEAIG